MLEYRDRQSTLLAIALGRGDGCLPRLEGQRVTGAGAAVRVQRRVRGRRVRAAGDGLHARLQHGVVLRPLLRGSGGDRRLRRVLPALAGDAGRAVRGQPSSFLNIAFGDHRRGRAVVGAPHEVPPRPEPSLRRPRRDCRERRAVGCRRRIRGRPAHLPDRGSRCSSAPRSAWRWRSSWSGRSVVATEGPSGAIAPVPCGRRCGCDRGGGRRLRRAASWPTHPARGST